MNLDKAQRLVERDICYCVSGLVATAMREGWDADPLIDTVAYQADWEEAVLQYLSGLTHEEWHTIIAQDLGGEGLITEPLNWIMATLRKQERGFQDFCQHRGIDPHEWEVYEHWLVTGWLAEKLREKGECVCDDWQGLTIWGRTTTGQAIAMDPVIQQIVKETYDNDD